MIALFEKLKKNSLNCSYARAMPVAMLAHESTAPSASKPLVRSACSVAVRYATVVATVV